MRPSRPASPKRKCSGRMPRVTAPVAVESVSRGDGADPHLAAGDLARERVDGRRPDEGGDEQAVRTQVKILGRVHLFDPALAHADDAVGHGGGLDLVVGDQDGGQPEALLQALDLGPHGQAQGGVEVAERLVEKQELGFLDQGAGQSPRAAAGRPTSGSACGPAIPPPWTSLAASSAWRRASLVGTFLNFSGNMMFSRTLMWG